jgi:hypothetical protein
LFFPAGENRILVIQCKLFSGLVISINLHMGTEIEWSVAVQKRSIMRWFQNLVGFYRLEPMVLAYSNKL